MGDRDEGKIFNEQAGNVYASNTKKNTEDPYQQHSEKLCSVVYRCIVSRNDALLPHTTDAFPSTIRNAKAENRANVCAPTIKLEKTAGPMVEKFLEKQTYRESASPCTPADRPRTPRRLLTGG